MKHLNLDKLLKYCINQQYYSPVFGYVKLIEITNNGKLKFETLDIDNQYLIVNSDGCISGNDHCIIYPDKNKDWDSYITSEILTWKDMIEHKKDIYMAAKVGLSMGTYPYTFTEDNTDVENSAVAFMQIMQLIDKGYGGLVSYSEFDDPIKSNDIYYIEYDVFKKRFYVTSPKPMKFASHLMFHGHENATRFLIYNKDLIRKFYNIK